MEILDLKKMAEEAVALQRQGNLAEAERLYLQILEADPALFGPRFYLGLMRLTQARAPEACAYFAEALAVYPNDLGLLMNYGMALCGAGRPQQALEMFERALAIRPDLPEALYNRGVALSDLDRFELAVEAYDQALALQPEMMAALVNRGVALAAMRRFEDAIAAYSRALAMQPSNVPALVHRGLAYRALKQPAQALADYERALVLRPDDIDALYNRGVALMDLERAADALVMFDTVLPAYQNNAEMLNNRGVALWNLKRPAEALESYEGALALEPEFTEAWGNRGLALRDLFRHEEALASFDQVLRLEPHNAIALNHRANVLRDFKRYDEAIEDYDRAIGIRPDYTEALINRGYTKWTLKQYGEGLADVQRALRLDPDHPFAQGEVLHMRMYTADWTDFARLKADVEAGVRAGKRVVQPFNFQAIVENPADARTCSRIWAQYKYPEMRGAYHDRAARQKNAKAGKKIRIGYVSGEFRQQATAILMAGVYERHDRDKFELIALDAGVSDGSPMRARLEKAFEGWIDISKLSDLEAAQAVREAGVDILVNLNGYFGDARMGVFAQRPAPLQVNYLGFPATLGAPYIDYIIADRTVVPPSERQFYDEQVVYLPGCYQANDNQGREMARTPSRAEAGLPDEGFVFCNFNTAYKLTPATFDSWVRILRQVEGGVLWLLESPPPFANNLRKEAEARGVAADRLIFAPDLPTDLHLARLPLADLFLDGLPYNAHTTGSDALWAGVPLITQTGSAFPGRVATSLLEAAGLPELITDSTETFETLAVKLAKDAGTLARLRDQLAKNKADCALFDTAAFTRHLEAAFQAMWQNWLAGEQAKGFAVEA